MCRYVERNPVRAKLVDSANLWPFGSFYRWNQTSEPEPTVLSPWPIRRLPNWNRRVDAALSAKELAEVRTCVERGRLLAIRHGSRTLPTDIRYGIRSAPPPRPEKQKRLNNFCDQ